MRSVWPTLRGIKRQVAFGGQGRAEADLGQGHPAYAT